MVANPAGVNSLIRHLQFRKARTTENLGLGRLHWTHLLNMQTQLALKPPQMYSPLLVTPPLRETLRFGYVGAYCDVTGLLAVLVG
jgi:hypothetical protein